MNKPTSRYCLSFWLPERLKSELGYRLRQNENTHNDEEIAKHFFQLILRDATGKKVPYITTDYAQHSDQRHDFEIQL